MAILMDGTVTLPHPPSQPAASSQQPPCPRSARSLLQLRTPEEPAAQVLFLDRQFAARLQHVVRMRQTADRLHCKLIEIAAV